MSGWMLWEIQIEMDWDVKFQKANSFLSLLVFSLSFLIFIRFIWFYVTGMYNNSYSFLECEFVFCGLCLLSHSCFLWMFACVWVGISGFFLGSEGRCTSKDQLVLSGGTHARTHTHTNYTQDAFIPQSSTIDFTSNALSLSWRQNQLCLGLCVCLCVCMW